jgi:glyoxylase-like metal-dependent hydrolase (beta-lactamase superfamily II)
MSKTKKIVLSIATALVVIIVAITIFMYPFISFFFHTETIQYDPSLTIIKGGGGNSALLVTDSAVVVIDTKMGGNAKKLFDLAKEKAGGKKIIVINTHFHGDHVSGNFLYSGSRIIIGAYDTAFLHKYVKPENQPNEFVKDSLELNLGNDTLLLFNMGQAHSLNDMIVILKKRKLLISGDLVFYNMNPVLNFKSGADVDKWIAVLKRILARNDYNKIVPGHGILGGKELAESLIKYFDDMKAAAADPAKAKEIKTKYKDWMTMPMMANPDKTIEFINAGK